MGKVVVETVDNRYVSGAYRWPFVVAVGAATGLLVWVLALVLGRFIVGPIVCGNTGLSECANVDLMSGNIAAVLGAVAGTVGLLRLGVTRAIFVSVAALVLFWGVSVYTQPLWWVEAIIWTVLMYGLGYLLLTWISRLRSLLLVIVLMVVVVVLVRYLFTV